MEEFHDFMSAFVTTIIVSATGSENIYEKQFLINPLIASIWHWALICVMYVVCLNLILCILVDAYAGTVMARSKSDGPMPSLYEQGVDTAQYLTLALYAACKQAPNESVKLAVGTLRRASMARASIVPVVPEESPNKGSATSRAVSLFKKRSLEGGESTSLGSSKAGDTPHTSVTVDFEEEKYDLHDTGAIIQLQTGSESV
jgi:hypothetical protein